MYFFYIYINLVKYLQRNALDVSINLRYLQGKVIQKYKIWDHTGSIQKQPSAGIWKRLRETRRMLNIVKKIVMVKAGIPPSIRGKIVGRVRSSV